VELLARFPDPVVIQIPIYNMESIWGAKVKKARSNSFDKVSG
jgi:hypothetical protein